MIEQKWNRKVVTMNVTLGEDTKFRHLGNFFWSAKHTS